MLLVSYVWGGCVSCDQFFMMPGSDGKCCHPDRCDRQQRGKAPQPTGQDCDKLAVRHSPAVDTHLLSAMAASNITAVLVAPPALVSLIWVRAEADPVAESPPDLSVLHGSLLL